jgi:sulfur-oxidizing protein SoxA
MLLKIVRTSVLVVLAGSALSAAAFNVQAEKDRLALRDYTVAKFQDVEKNKYTFLPYSPDEILETYNKNIKAEDFALGSYAYNQNGKNQRDDMMELPPFEEKVEQGEEAYNKHFKTCFPDVTTSGDYPRFNETSQKVETLSTVLYACAQKAGLKTGKKGYNLNGGKMASLQAYIATQSAEEGKSVNIKIDSAAASDAYENGKEEFYTQRGYLKLSCASCHIQGAGQSVRLDFLSPTFGSATHFPVYRISKDKLFTLEGRLGGCNRDQGEDPHKAGSTWSNNVLYFMSYMSNGLKLDGPDIRK